MTDIGTRQTNRPPEPPVHLSPGLWEFTKRMLVVALFAALALLVWYALYVLLLAFAGVLVAVLLTALADLVSRHTRLSHGWALAVVLAALVIVAGLLGWLLATQITAQVTELSQKLPESVNKFRDYLEQFSWGHALLHETTIDQKQIVGRVGGALSITGDAVAGLLLILFVGIYGAAEPDLYRKGILYLLPAPHRERGGEVLNAVNATLRRWMAGQLLVMFITGVLVTVGLKILGMKFALALGIIAFVLEVIPVLGPFLFAIPGILLALAVSPRLALGVLILYVVVQGIESNLLIPIVQKRTVRLPPVLTLLVVTLAWILGGALGVFLAAPLTATALVLVQLLWVKDTLGTTSVQVPGEKDGHARQPSAAR
jgi:predicted PurR-regulated permease PerM